MATRRGKSARSAAKSRKVPRGTAIVLRQKAKPLSAAKLRENTALALRVLAPEAIIERAVAVRTAFLQAEVNRLTDGQATLSERIGRLENPDAPRAGEVGSGTGIFPRDALRVRPEIVGRPGTIRDAAAELVAGDRAREALPSSLDALRAGRDPYNHTPEELELMRRENGAERAA